MTDQRLRKLEHQADKGRRMGIPAALDLQECLDEIASIKERSHDIFHLAERRRCLIRRLRESLEDVIRLRGTVNEYIDESDYCESGKCGICDKCRYPAVKEPATSTARIDQLLVATNSTEAVYSIVFTETEIRTVLEVIDATVPINNKWKNDAAVAIFLKLGRVLDANKW